MKNKNENEKIRKRHDIETTKVSKRAGVWGENLFSKCWKHIYQTTPYHQDDDDDDVDNTEKKREH